MLHMSQVKSTEGANYISLTGREREWRLPPSCSSPHRLTQKFTEVQSFENKYSHPRFFAYILQLTTTSLIVCLHGCMRWINTMSLIVRDKDNDAGFSYNQNLKYNV